MNQELYYRIFPLERANKIANRERNQLAGKSVLKQLVIKRLPLPEDIRRHIEEYCFTNNQKSFIAKHNRLMRKIVYIIKNAYYSSRKYDETPIRFGYNGCRREIQLSRGRLTRSNLNLYKRNHFMCESSQQSHLIERSYKATNCMKCGHFLGKMMAHHYREFDDPQKEQLWYDVLRKQGLGPAMTPYHDRLWCKCQREMGQPWWWGAIAIVL